jgi:hypothetical protein
MPERAINVAEIIVDECYFGTKQNVTQHSSVETNTTCRQNFASTIESFLWAK